MLGALGVLGGAPSYMGFKEMRPSYRGVAKRCALVIEVVLGGAT